jgi:hypothetical protein
MVSETQTLEGITSQVIGKEGYHYPFFDVEHCSQEEAERGIGKLQTSFNLPDCFLVSDIERSYRNWCFGQVRFTDYLIMQLYLLDIGILDYNFFWWTVNLSKGTLRTSNKKNRLQQELVTVLKSYSVPIPKKVERVIYDTGIEKRGLTIFLGEKGRIIRGD